MRVVVLVPRRADGGDRDRLWQFARAWWLEQHDWPIIEGHHVDGPFNRSVAVNRAALEAGEWDVACIIDADIIANPDAVRDAVDIAHATGRMVVSHHDRIMLNRVGTQKILDGYRGPWRAKQMVETIYTDSVSCAIAVPRVLWDQIGGFPENVVGWGHEDSMFAIAAETFTGRPLIRLASELYHLWHAVSPGVSKSSPTRQANIALLDRYKAAAGDPQAVRRLLDEARGAVVEMPTAATRIPRILHRTVPAKTTVEVEAWWVKFSELHAGWDLRTHREPLDPADWPLTGDLWGRCQNGAQKAGLIRLECLVTHGGIYVDSDVEPFRSLEPLLHVPAFAGWEDETTVPDAVLGAEPNHPAFVQMLAKARSVLEGGGDAWQSGPGVVTETLPGRPDVLLLPPGAFYDFHYLQKSREATPVGPWTFARHHWHGSWLNAAQRKSIAQRQRK